MPLSNFALRWYPLPMPAGESLLCHRCGAEGRPGESGFFADPTAPAITADDLQTDLKAEMARLIEQMKSSTERELVDQVHRRLTIHLCGPCHRGWIENPTG
jgi:hypothetical protein